MQYFVIKVLLQVCKLSFKIQIRLCHHVTSFILFLHKIFGLGNIQEMEYNLQTFLKLEGLDLIEMRKQVIFHTLYTLLETARVWKNNEGDEIYKSAKIEGSDILKQSPQQGKIVVAFHSLCFEIANYILNRHFPLHTTYQSGKNKTVNKIIERFRRNTIGTIVQSNRLKTLVSLLKNGQSIWIAPDQGIQSKNTKQVPLFGIDIPVLQTIPKLARMTNAIVIVMIAGRNKDNLQSIEIEYHKIQAKDINEYTLNYYLERQITKYPEQYSWVYNMLKLKIPAL